MLRYFMFSRLGWQKAKSKNEKTKSLDSGLKHAGMTAEGAARELWDSPEEGQWDSPEEGLSLQNNRTPTASRSFFNSPLSARINGSSAKRAALPGYEERGFHRAPPI